AGHLLQGQFAHLSKEALQTRLQHLDRGGNRRQFLYAGCGARNQMDWCIRMEIEIDTGLPRHQGLDLELRSQTALDELIDIGPAARPVDDLEVVGVDLDEHWDGELLPQDVVVNDNLGHRADPDTAKCHGRTNFEPAE